MQEDGEAAAVEDETGGNKAGKGKGKKNEAGTKAQTSGTEIEKSVKSDEEGKSTHTCAAAVTQNLGKGEFNKRSSDTAVTSVNQHNRDFQSQASSQNRNFGARGGPIIEITCLSNWEASVTSCC